MICVLKHLRNKDTETDKEEEDNINRHRGGSHPRANEKGSLSLTGADGTATDGGMDSDF